MKQRRKGKRRRGKKWGKGVQGAVVGGVGRQGVEKATVEDEKGGGRGGCRESFEALIW